MLLRRGQALSRLLGKPSFAGAGLLERMRSTTFALLGITAAMGLGLVAVVSQQSFSVLPAAPLPDLLAESGEVHDAIEVASGPGSPAPASKQARDGRGPVAGRPASTRGASAPGSRLSESRQLATAPPRSGAAPPAPSPAPPAAAPSPPAPAEPSPQAPSPPAAPAPAAAPAAPPAVAAVATGPGNGNAYGRAKSSGAPKPKPSRPASSPPASAPATATVEADQGAKGAAAPAVVDEPPAANGKGGGNAYGHAKK